MGMTLSVITINFNNAEGLKRTIESIEGQTFSDYEHIIIDGASTDGSVDILREYQNNSTRKIKVISEPDSGIYNAMNKGIRMSCGDYLNFMNSGDCFYSSVSLSGLFKNSYSEDILICDAIFMFKGHEVVFCDASSCNYDYDFFMRGSLPHQASFFKRSTFDKYGIYDESLRIVADWKYFVETIYYGGATTKYVPVKMCLYEGNGISSGKSMQNERKKVADQLFHPHIQKDIALLTEYKNELLFIKQSRITRTLYNLIYRLAQLIIDVRAIMKK